MCGFACLLRIQRKTRFNYAPLKNVESLANCNTRADGSLVYWVGVLLLLALTLPGYHGERWFFGHTSAGANAANTGTPRVIAAICRDPELK
jgi:hypothetical protein